MTDIEMRELDAWCAENVMGEELPMEIGFRYTNGRESWGNSEEYTRQKFRKYKEAGIADCLLERRCTDDFSPTTNPTAALMVLERCAIKLEKDADATCTGVLICAPDARDPLWTVATNGDDITAASAPTLPLAIALFARKVWG